MTVFGVSLVVAGWFAIAILLSILLPLYFGLKFTWDPSSVAVDTSEYETQQTSGERKTEKRV